MQNRNTYAKKITTIFYCVTLKCGVKRNDSPYHICWRISKPFQTLTNLFRFADDIEEMTGTRPNLFWMVCWKYISPAALIVILFSSFYNIIKDSPSYKLYVGCIQQEVSLDIYFFCSDIVAMIIISLNMALTIALVQINQSKKPTKILTETFLV